MKCPECGQPTKFHDLCNDCVDKFMKELDRDLEGLDCPLHMYNFNPPSLFRYIWQRITSKKKETFKCMIKNKK